MEGQRSMRILCYACHEGVQVNLLREWVAQGHDVHLVNGSVSWQETRAAIPEGVKLDPCDSPDVISVGATQDISRALWRNLIRLSRSTPIVMTHWWFPSTKRLAGLLYRRSVQVSVCEFGGRYLQQHWRMDSPAFYCPVDAEAFQPQPIQPDPKLVVVVGNHFPSRPIMGWEKLVEIMAKVGAQDPDVHFQILGENPEIDTEKFPNVSTLSLKQNEMPPYQAKARCAVFTTAPNLIPHSLLGAMACGKTVVAFDLESLHEVIEDGRSGYLIPSFDTDAFAARILQLTREEPDPQIASRARENVLAKCDHRLVANQYLDLFARLCS